MEKPKLRRCGWCGDFDNASMKEYSEEEQANAELYDCGCNKGDEVRYVTRDMAIDAGDSSLEGSRY